MRCEDPQDVQKPEKICLLHDQEIIETSGVKNRLRSGLLRSGVTHRFKDIVKQRVRQNPWRSIRKLASELLLSCKSLRSIVKKDLVLSFFKTRTADFLLGQKVRSQVLLDGSPSFAGHCDVLR